MKKTRETTHNQYRVWKTIFIIDSTDVKRKMSVMNTFMPFRRNGQIPQKMQIARTCPREKLNNVIALYLYLKKFNS